MPLLMHGEPEAMDALAGDDAWDTCFLIFSMQDSPDGTRIFARFQVLIRR